jgi:uncharacterized repeat protein (TIGR03803 family)
MFDSENHCTTPGSNAPPETAGLIFDARGNLYSTTSHGGGSGNGTVFKVDPTTRKETILYSFTGGVDGTYPYAGVIWDAKGNLYGNTLHGGDVKKCSDLGCGVVFKLDPATSEKEEENDSWPSTRR